MLVRRIIIYYVYFASAMLINTKELLRNFIFLSFRPLAVKSSNLRVFMVLVDSKVLQLTTGHDPQRCLWHINRLRDCTDVA